MRTRQLSGFVAVVVAGPATAAPATARATVAVIVEAVEALIAFTTSLSLPTQAEARLVTKLAVAKNAFAHAFPRAAVNRLTAFGEVEVQRGTTLTDQQADRLVGQAKQIINCV